MALKTSATNPVIVSGNEAIEVIANEVFDIATVKVIDTIKTTVTKVYGLDQTTAKTYAESQRSNNMRDYNVSHSEGLVTYYVRCPLARGTKKSASYQQEGNSRMYTVTVTEEVHACTNSAGWL